MFSNSQCPLKSDGAMTDPIQCQMMKVKHQASLWLCGLRGLLQQQLTNQIKRPRPQNWGYLWSFLFHFTARDSSICCASVNSFGNKSWSKHQAWISRSESSKEGYVLTGMLRCTCPSETSGHYDHLWLDSITSVGCQMYRKRQDNNDLCRQYTSSAKNEVCTSTQFDIVLIQRTG